MEAAVAGVLRWTRDLAPVLIWGASLQSARDRECPPCPSLRCAELSCPPVTCGSCTCPSAPGSGTGGGLFSYLLCVIAGAISSELLRWCVGRAPPPAVRPPREAAAWQGVQEGYEEVFAPALGNEAALREEGLALARRRARGRQNA